jgi:hypothetical protein
MKRVASHSTLAWVTLALIGLVVAVSVSYAASQLSKPSVGLTSEPVSGVSDLAPKPPLPGRPRRRTRLPEHPAHTTPAPTPGTSPTPPPTNATPGATPHESDDSGSEDD